MKDLKYSEVVAKADSIKAVMGPEPTIYLRDAMPPYEKACAFEPGCAIRLSTNVSGYFTAVVKGIRCRWSFDLEDRGANGTGSLAPNVEAIGSVMRRLEGTARTQFRDWLVEVATKVRADAAELRSTADQQTAKAATLADIAGQP